MRRATSARLPAKALLSGGREKGPGRCEFFSRRPGSEEEGDLDDVELPARSRGFYRFLDASSEGVRSFSLCGTESVNSLVADASAPDLKKKVFFLGFPSPLDEEFGLSAMETLKTELCEGLGLEAVFFCQDETCVPRVLKDRSQEILARRLIYTVQSCDAACLDVSPRPTADSERLSWTLGMFAGTWKPVVGYGEAPEAAEGRERSLAWPNLVETATFSGAALGPDERRTAYVDATKKALLSLREVLCRPL